MFLSGCLASSRLAAGTGDKVTRSRVRAGRRDYADPCKRVRLSGSVPANWVSASLSGREELCGSGGWNFADPCGKIFAATGISTSSCQFCTVGDIMD